MFALDNMNFFNMNLVLYLDGTTFRLPSGSFGVFLGSEELGSSGLHLSVGSFGFFGSFFSGSSSSFLASLSLKSDWGDESLDLWRLGSGFGVFLVSFQFSSDDKVSDIVFLFKVKQLPDLVSPLWPQSSVNGSVSNTSNLVITFSDDNGRNNGQIV